MHRPPLPSRKYSWYSFLLEAESTGRIMSIKTPSDTIGNRTLDLPDSSAAPQPSAPPRVVTVTCYNYVFFTMQAYCVWNCYSTNFRHITALSIISAHFTKFYEYVEVSPVNLFVCPSPAANISFLSFPSLSFH